MRATCALLAIFSIAVHAGTITVNDDRSNAIVLAAPAQRIVALAPSNWCLQLAVVGWLALRASAIIRRQQKTFH